MKTGLPGGPVFLWTRPLGVRVQRVQKVQKVQRVQKVQKVQRVVVGGYAANINKTFRTGLCPVENRQTALAGVGNAPLFPYGDFS